MITILDLIRKDSKMMARIYYNRLLVGTIVFESIPEKYQAACLAYGRSDVEAGKMPVEQFEQMFHVPYEE